MAVQGVLSLSMRLLVLAGILSLLAGCSLPYEGTSFKANPELEAALRGHGKEESHAEGEKQVATGMRMYQADTDDKTTPRENGSMDQTGVVFPPTAQPGQ